MYIYTCLAAFSLHIVKDADDPRLAVLLGQRNKKPLIMMLLSSRKRAPLATPVVVVVLVALAKVTKYFRW